MKRARAARAAAQKDSRLSIRASEHKKAVIVSERRASAIQLLLTLLLRMHIRRRKRL